jgi:hypothetical protein
MAEVSANTTSIKSKDWIFNTLWSSCGWETGPKCLLNVPLTFVFKNGAPVKALTTDDASGEVTRVDFQNIELERTNEESIHRGASNRGIRIVRKLLLDFAEHYGYFSAQKAEEPMLASVTYTDGEREDLNIRAFDVLMRNDFWRPQILILQAYVPTLSIQAGMYQPDKGEKKVRSLLESTGAEAADKLTRALAKFAEQSYKVSEGGVLGVKAPKSKFSGKALDVKLTVLEMRASFSLDPTDKVMFLFSDYTMIDLDNGRKEAEQFLEREKKGREKTAALSVYAELQTLLHHAMKRGLSVQDSFAHFDVQRTGFVDTDMLVDGLSRLGIGVTYGVGEAMLQLIGGLGANFIALKDFAGFLKNPTPENMLGDGGAGSPIRKKGSRKLKSLDGSGSPGEDSNSLFPPDKPHGASLPPLDGVLSLDASQSISSMMEGYMDDDFSAGALGELPAPEEQYTDGLRPKQRESASTLGNGASKRNHRALKELRSSYNKWNKKKAAAAGGGDEASPERKTGAANSSPTAGSKKPPSRGGSRGAKRTNGAQSSAAQNEMEKAQRLNLTTIVTEMNSRLNRSPDEVCHLEKGVVMTFRVVQGAGLEDIRTKEKTDIIRERSVMEEKQAKMDELGMLDENKEDGKSEDNKYVDGSTGEPMAAGGGASHIDVDEEGEPKPDRWVAFTLVLIPDLFMTLDTLQKAFERLLVKYPHSRIVLVGLPGLPNTVWPKGWSLNPDLHARAIAQLMQFLRKTKRLSPMVGEPIYFMGFGTGAHSLSRFMTLYAPGLPWLEDLCKCVIFVNGLLKYNKAFRQVCKDLRSSLMQAGAHEVNELITSLHFWDQYMNLHEKGTVLKGFWETRRGLANEDVDHSKSGLGYVGVLEQLRGILTTSDDFDGAQLLTTQLPVLVVQSTEDVFVNPRNAAIYQTERLPPERNLVTDIIDSLDMNAVHISWLQAGHEVVQERTPFLLGLISNLAQMCGVHPVRPPDGSAADEDDEEVFDVLELAQKRRDAAAAAEEQRIKDEAEAAEKAKKEKAEAREAKKKRKDDKAEAKAVAEAEEAERKRIEDEAREKKEKEEKEAFEKAEKERIECEEKEKAEKAELDKLNDEERRKRNAAEKERRNKLAAERRRREKKAARRAEMEQFYERERIEKERKEETAERKKMEKEEKRSRFAADYAKQQENTARGRRIAAKKAEELRQRRKEEAIRRVEERLSRERAARQEERRKKAEEAVKKIQAEFLVLSGEADGGYDVKEDMHDPDGVSALMTSCHNILGDLLTVRQRQVECMKRQGLVEGKYTVFKNQVAATDNEIRMLRRAIRLIEQNPSVVGAKLGGPDPDELIELRRNLANKEETFLELTAVSKSREAQLTAANFSVQSLKVVAKERNDLIQVRIREMQDKEEELGNRAKELRNEKERENEVREKLKLKEKLIEERLHILNKERKRIKGHTGKTVDTDAWIEGVMQRSQTKELKAHLKEEVSKEEAKVKIIREEMFVLREKMFETEDRIHSSKRQADKMAKACAAFIREYRKFANISAADLMHELSDQQNAASRSEDRKEREAKQIALQQDARESATEEKLNMVDEIRKKDFELRSKDERKFVGIDLVMNPEAYLHVSMVEAEQMRFDEDYNCELSKADVERIYKLPENVNLALPFIHTFEELEAHRLINLYERGLDNGVFKLRDHLYEEPKEKIQDALGEHAVSGGDAAGSIGDLKPTDMHDAAILHDILVKEAARDRIRAKGAGDDFTEDERNWMSIDKILCPEIYDLKHFEDDVKNRPVASDLSHNAVHRRDADRVIEGDTESPIRKQNRDNPMVKKDSNMEGNKYQELRWRYEGGEVIFDNSWRCHMLADEILEVRARADMTYATEDELKVRRLLDKYYVSDNESVLGNARLQSILKVSAEIATMLNDSKKDEALEARAKKVERAMIRGDAAESENPEHLEEMKQEMAALRKKMGLDDAANINRVWGGWEQVHPASAGEASQTSYFAKSTFDPSRDHPGVYGLHDEGFFRVDGQETTVTGGRKVLPTGKELAKLSLSTLKSQPGDIPAHFDIHDNDPESEYLIADSTKELALMEVRRIKGKSVLLAVEEPMTLFHVDDLHLQSRQSRSHRFEIPNREDSRVMEFSVSIIFQGGFSQKGYKLGRLAAGLFRLPDEKDPNASPVPIPVGFSPYSMQSPNLPESLGRVVILHKPKRRPILPGYFQIVIGVASGTKYSIEVSAKIAKSALPVVDAGITKAKEMQARMPSILLELDALQESHVLAERKLVVCQRMITEAETESERCKRGMAIVSHKLEVDDEEMTLLEDERKELERELSILEVEYAQWANLFESRHQEFDDIKDGIKLIFEFQRQRQEEKKKIKKALDQARHDLPACIAALRGIIEASNVAISLNTIVQGASQAWGASISGANNQKGSGPSLVTPAEDVRRRFKREGFERMMEEEKQWLLMDQVMNPHKYEWLKEKEEEEFQRLLAMGKQPEKEKLSASLESFKMPKSEIQHIMKAPFSMLSRKDMIVRKLIVKYHDDPSVLRRSAAAVAYGFDPRMAERTRAKMPKTYSKEEKEWSSIDRILHPEVWQFYVNHDKNTGSDRKAADSKLNTDTAEGGKSGMFAREADDKPKVSQSKQNTALAMGKILGMADDFAKQAQGDNVNLEEMLEGAQTALTQKKKTEGDFICMFPKDKIFQIWRTPKHKLKTDDERHTFKLLQKYNGTYEAYMTSKDESDRRKGLATKAGSHIIWEAAGRTPEVDIDTRARVVLAEIERAANCMLPFMQSDVLHTSDQMFPTPVLRVQLNEELDNILANQIKDRERAQKMRIDSDDDETSSDEDEVPFIDPDLEGDEKEDAEKEIKEKVKRRARRREKRKLKLSEPDIEHEIVAVKKKLDVKGKSGRELEEMQLLNQLGFGGCLACRTNPCKWEPCVDVPVVSERKKILDQESERVRLDKDSETIESDLCLSAQLGGNRVFRRLDLLEELAGETVELERNLHLNDVDRELHDAYSSRSEFVEVKSLHGYSMMLWVNNARVALEARQSRLVAYTVAKEAVDDILDWMLEGWYFGERESSFAALGLVPSVAEGNNGYVRAGQDQITAVGATIKKLKERRAKKKKGEKLPETLRGTIAEKSAPIELDKDERLRNVKVARDGNRHEHMLNETESSLRFGIFMLTLMYFRAMTFLAREKKSWGGVGDPGSKQPKLMTDERMQMVEEENRLAARKKKVETVLARSKVGEARRLTREAAERREAVQELQKVVRRQKLEFNSVTTIQRVFRGHVGRKAAKRWALKRAELGAMNALLNATAICIQRCYRGYLARVLTVRKRAEMAQFIALMRAQEAQADEEVFWETHPWQRFKRDQKEWTDKKLRAAHKTEVLGGARLSEEEEEAMKEAAMDAIDDEMGEEESDSDDEVDPDEQAAAEAEAGVAGNADELEDDD